MTATLESEIRERLDKLNPAERRLAEIRLQRIITRKKAVRRFPTPGHLARYIYPDTIQTQLMVELDKVALACDSGMQRQWLISTPPQEGKATCGKVPIMSIPESQEIVGQAGFRPMSDIEVGDWVFHPSGKPVRVLWKSPRMDDHPLYRVTTSDSRSLVVDEEHLWTVQDRRKVKSRHREDGSGYDRWMEWETVTTRDLIDRGLEREKPRQRASGSWTRANAFRLPTQECLQTNDVDLPIDPYLLGLWLADGCATGAQIIEGVADADELADNLAQTGAMINGKKAVVRAEGGQAVVISFSLDKPRGRNGFLPTARKLNILGDKHIPELYLTAGVTQRLALLQGLLDGDGAISTNGRTFRVEYTTVIPRLAEQVLFLVRSLGWRATLRDSRSMLNGVEKRRRYRVTFTPVRGELPPFRLARKATRVQVDKSRGDERHVVTISSIEPAGRGAVYCIQVDSEDGLFLAGRDLVATHNSQRMAEIVPLWFLLRDPSRRIVVASYEQGLAARSTLAVRQAIEIHGAGYKGDRRGAGQGDELGLVLDPDRAQQTNWNLADVPGRRNGGMVAVGVGSAFTGRSADILIIDDPVKGAQAADSVQQRRATQDWYQAVARTRLSGNAIVIVIQTRWHEDDLMGWLIREDDLLATPRWSRLIVPAVAKHHDPLGREPGEYLVSARGRTPEDWDQIRKDVGERWWAALYDCDPHPPAGGVFKLEWITNNRVKAAPELERTEVFVDPADNEGKGDEAGVIVAARGVDRRYYVLEDASDHMTVGRWLRVAFLAALRWSATAVRFERSLSGLDRQAKQAWKDLLREARKLNELWQATALPDLAWPALPTGVLLMAAVNDLARDDATAAERTKLEQELLELWPWVPNVLTLPETGVPVRGFPARGSKTFRAQMVAPLYEGGHVSHVGHFPELEHQQVAWQEGQDSPDRMDCNVHALTELSRTGGPSEMSGARGQLPTRTTQSTIPRLGSRR